MLGRPSILPKQMLCSSLLRGFYPLRTPALLDVLFGRSVGPRRRTWYTRERLVTSHVAQNISCRRPPSIVGRPATGAMRAAQRVRKVTEEAFGYTKTIAGQARTELRGLAEGAGRPRPRWKRTT
jgi:hypothetical protein